MDHVNRDELPKLLVDIRSYPSRLQLLTGTAIKGIIRSFSFVKIEK